MASLTWASESRGMVRANACLPPFLSGVTTKWPSSNPATWRVNCFISRLVASTNNRIAIRTKADIPNTPATRVAHATEVNRTFCDTILTASSSFRESGRRQGTLSDSTSASLSHITRYHAQFPSVVSKSQDSTIRPTHVLYLVAVPVTEIHFSFTTSSPDIYLD